MALRKQKPEPLLAKKHISCLWVLYTEGKRKNSKLQSGEHNFLSEFGLCPLWSLSRLSGRFGGHNPFRLPLAGLTNLGNPEYAYFFTGKELYEDEALQWYDYGARMGVYLALSVNVQIGRWTSHDPEYHFASPYDYCGGDQINYIDPDGRFVLTLLALSTGQLWALPFTIYFDFFTETGYDVQKYVSPVAVNIDARFGTHQRRLGINTSIGVPQIMPLNIRVHGGITYYTKNYGMDPGWEKRYGAEVGITPFVRVGFTEFDSPGEKFDQRLGHVTIGVPGKNLKYANDWMFDTKLGDNGDRYRTAALKAQIGPLDIGFNLFTGDPGLDDDDREHPIDPETGKQTYTKNIKGNDPDQYRSGVGYIGLFGFRFGNDTEARRDKIQNKIVHENFNSPYFKVMNRPNKFYFQTGGYGLW